MARLLIIPAFLITLVVAFLAWSGRGATSKADFVYIDSRDVITLDPQGMSYMQDIRLANAIWEGLLTPEPRTLKPIPGAAERYDVSADGKAYTFHLRANGKWSDGSEVTAGDFEFAWRRMLEEPGEYTYLHFYITGAKAYSEAMQTWFDADRVARDAWAKDRKGVRYPGTPDRPAWEKVGVKVVDRRTLRVELDDPVTFFPDLMAFVPFFPLHAASMKPFREPAEEFKADPNYNGRTRYDGRFTRPPSLVGNGPFRLTTWEFKRRLRLEQNEHYWDRANVVSRTIESQVVDDPLTRVLRYEAGDVDWLTGVPAEFAPEIKQQQDENRRLRDGKPIRDMRIFGGFGTTYLTLNTRPQVDGLPNALNDERVRRALAMSVDRSLIVTNITRMGERPSTTFTPPDAFAGYAPTGGHGFDPKAARALIAEAYPDLRTFPRVVYLYPTDAGNASKEMAQFLASQWKQNLGIAIEIEGMERKTVRQRLKDVKFYMTSSNWIGDYADVSTFTDLYRKDSQNNHSGWVNLKYEELLDAATKEPDAVKRLAIIRDAEKLLNDEAAIIPLYNITNQFLFRDDVVGVYMHPRNTVLFKYVGRQK